MSVEELKRMKNISKLSVGARALQKHSHRSSDGFWGSATGSEIQRNSNANKVAVSILKECVWINVHKVLHSEVIIECRVI